MIKKDYTDKITALDGLIKSILFIMKKINLLHEFFNSKSDVNVSLLATEQEKLEREFQEWNDQRKPDFEEVVIPVIKYMAENLHPHTKIIITSTSAELLEGVKTTDEILEYLVD